MVSATDQTFELIGTVGGCAIALSLLPQVILSFRTKCTADISYTYQFIYICGTGLVSTYALYFGHWAVYGPCLLESSLIITLTLMKIAYDRRNRLLHHDDSQNTKQTTGGLRGSLFSSILSDMNMSGNVRTGHITAETVYSTNSLAMRSGGIFNTSPLDGSQMLLREVHPSVAALVNLLNKVGELSSNDNEVVSAILQLTSDVEERVEKIVDDAELEKDEKKTKQEC